LIDALNKKLKLFDVENKIRASVDVKNNSLLMGVKLEVYFISFAKKVKWF
jgi:hypothetical protein